MATYGSDKVAFLLVDGYSILGVSTEFSESKDAVLEETTPLGVPWGTTAYAGLRRAELSQNGFFDDAANAVNDALVAKTGISRLVAYGIEGNVAGKAFTGFSGAMQSNYKRQASSGELHKASSAMTGNGIVDEGVILHPLAQETTTTGNTEGASSVDNGVSSPNGGAAHLHVTQLTLGGFTNAAWKVRHSADDITYADLVSFTVATAAPFAERKTVAGTVNRHLASSWAFTGAGAGQSVTAMVGFSRG
jgi:hypothetical protein